MYSRKERNIRQEEEMQLYNRVWTVKISQTVTDLSINELHYFTNNIKMNSNLNHRKRERNSMTGRSGKECTEGRTSGSDRNTAGKSHCSGGTATPTVP